MSEPPPTPESPTKTPTINPPSATCQSIAITLPYIFDKKKGLKSRLAPSLRNRQALVAISTWGRLAQF
jgi:hypothetical protein